MSGDSKTQATTTSGTNAPWSKAQPALETGLKEATNLYESGIGSQPYTGSTVVPYADQSMQGFNASEGMANKALGGGDYGYMSGAMNQLGQYAGGQNLDGRNNPEFNKLVTRAQDDAANQVNMGAMAAGRYGSGVHQGNVAREVGNVTSNMLSDNYNNEVRNMFQAQQQLPGAYGAAQAPAQSLGGIGQAYEDLYARQKNDELRVFDATQNAPWNQLAKLNAIATGAGSMGGTQTQVQRAPTQGGGWQGAAGNAMTGYAMSGGNPLGAVLGGVSGYYG